MIRVLVIEDDVDFGWNITRYLNSFPNEFLTQSAPDGETGLKIVASTDVDIVLTDIMLPGIQGIEVIRKIFATDNAPQIVAMTGHTSPELRSLALREGALRFLEKPIDLEDLRLVLWEAIDLGPDAARDRNPLDFIELCHLLVATIKTATVRIRFGRDVGHLSVRDGSVVHASTTRLEGIEAFHRMAGWRTEGLEELSEDRSKNFPENISLAPDDLSAELERLTDGENWPDGDVTPGDAEETREEFGAGLNIALKGDNTLNSPKSQSHKTKSSKNNQKRIADQARKETVMSLEGYLEDFKGIKGYLGSAIMEFTGEALAVDVVDSKTPLEAASATFNDIFRSAHEASTKIGLDACNTLVITTPKGLVVMQCSGVDSSLHLHWIVLLGKDGNQALAKMTIERLMPKVMEELA